MPVSFSSAARNLFLLGSSGADVVTNFFKAIDQSSTAEEYIVKGLKYTEYDEQYIIAGKAENSSNVKHGWVSKRQDSGSETWGVTLDETTGLDLVLTDIHLDVNGKLVVIGSVETSNTERIPFISRYTGNGVLEWQSTSNSANVRYKGVATDADGNCYVCGNTQVSGDAQAFIEKFDTDGNPGWGKSAINLQSDVILGSIDIDTKGYVIASGTVQDTNNEYKGYFVKIDTETGQVVWDRTLNITDRDWGSIPVVEIKDIKIDGNDFIYIVGTQFNAVSGDSAGFICKYNPEGNMLWQRETPLDPPNLGRWRYNCVEADTDTGQIVILGSYFENTSDEYGVLVKYSDKGDKIFTRVIESTEENPPEFGNLTATKGGMALDASASFYYVAFTDQDASNVNGTPDKYTYGKVSSSGNGLGDFSYQTGDLNTIEYYIQDLGDRIGRLSDGSVRYDTSDLATNILNPTRIMFDDFATPVTNKKRQMNIGGSFAYSGSPALRPVDFSEMNLISASGVTNITGKFYKSTTLYTTKADILANATELLGASFLGASNTEYFYYVPNGNEEFGRQVFSVDPAFTNSDSLNRTEWFWYNGSGWTKTEGGYSNSDYNNFSFGDDTLAYRLDKNRDFYAVGAINAGAPTLHGGTIPRLYEYSTWEDQSGNGKNAATYGPILFNERLWEFGNTALGIPPRAYIDAGVTAEELLGREFAVEMWFKVDDIPNPYNRLIEASKQNPFTGNLASINWALYVSGSGGGGGQGNLRKYGTGGDQTSNYGFVNDGSWHHVVMNHRLSTPLGQFSLSSFDIYLDGVNVSSNEQDDYDASLAFGNIRIGDSFDGFISDVRIYTDRSLTDQEVYQNYNATKSKFVSEAPYTKPRIGSGAVYDSGLLLNYDFGNKACYDFNENLISESAYYGNPQYWGMNSVNEAITNTTDVFSPVGDYTATKWTANVTTAQYIYVPIGALGTGATLNETNYTLSVYVRCPEGEQHDFKMYLSATGVQTFSPTFTATDKWERFTWNFTSNSETAIYPVLHEELGATLYVWGPQLERGSVANRYINTSGANMPRDNKIRNLSGSEYTGTLSGSTILRRFIATGYQQGLVEFQGFDSLTWNLITISDGSSSTVSWTFEAWIKPDTYSGSSDIADLSVTGSFGIQLEQGGTDAGKIRYRHSGLNLNWSNIALTANTWNHVVVLFSPFPAATSVSIQAYINNTFAYNTGHTEPLQTQIGGLGDGLEADIGEVRIYDRTLTDVEVAQNYNATRGKYGV